MTAALTEADWALLDLIGQGLSTLEISRALSLSPYVIDQRTGALRRKLGADSVARLRGMAPTLMQDRP